MMSEKEQRSAIVRMLHLISTAARYYSLQAKNGQNEVLANALPEMLKLLREYESLIKSEGDRSCPQSLSPSTLPIEYDAITPHL